MEAGNQYQRLGDMLLRKGLLNNRKLQRGLRVASESKRRIGDVLIDLGYASEEEIVQCLADQYGFDVVDLATVQSDPDALAKFTAEFALKWNVLPLEDGVTFRCAASDPVNVELTDMMAMIARKPLSLVLAPKTPLSNAIRAAYGLPLLAKKTGPKRLGRVPEPESVLQRDRAMLMDAINFEMGDHLQRRAS
jgi:type IV pilus assembly protein PilB